MSSYTLDRKLAAPVACTLCYWHGKCGQLMSRGNDLAGTLRCPDCDNPHHIIWIEARSTETLQ
jgi:hypothetical protein